MHISAKATPAMKKQKPAEVGWTSLFAVILGITVFSAVIFTVLCVTSIPATQSIHQYSDDYSPKQQDEPATKTPLSVVEEMFGLEWPTNDPSPRNVYEHFIHPLHSKWTELLNQKHIFGGEGFSAQLDYQTTWYIQTVQDMVRRKETAGDSGQRQNVRVCETGYNMGHSALTYLFGAEGLSERTKVEYFGFSFPHENHQMIAVEMKDLFGFDRRLGILWGDSTEFLPFYIDVEAKNEQLNRCDIVIVDGGHSLDVATKDIANMKQMANREHHVLIVDDLACDKGYCEGPVKAWNAAKAAHHITEDGCWGDGEGGAAMTAQRSGSRGFCWGKYNF